jgi:hypothetical protein
MALSLALCVGLELIKIQDMINELEVALSIVSMYSFDNVALTVNPNSLYCSEVLF